MLLNINDDRHLENPSSSEVQKSIIELEKEQFVVLSKSEDHYLQTYCYEINHYEVEYRDGSFKKHYGLIDKALTVKNIAEVFTFYHSDIPDWKTQYSWKPIDFEEDFEGDLNEENAFLLNGNEYKRIPVGSEYNKTEEVNSECIICGELKGSFHFNGCKREECPRCHYKLLTCDCE